jgi:uncharacterized membrane protein
MSPNRFTASYGAGCITVGLVIFALTGWSQSGGVAILAGALMGAGGIIVLSAGVMAWLDRRDA